MTRPETRLDRMLDWLPFLSMAALLAGLFALMGYDLWRQFR